MTKFKLIKIHTLGLYGFTSIIGENCSSIDDGEKVLNLIRPELIKGFSVELDFEGVKLVLTPFLNTCFGRL